MSAALRLVTQPDRLSDLLADWVLWMDGCSGRTVTARMQIVQRFHAATGADPLTCDWQTVAGFLAAHDNWSEGTVQTHRANLNAWFSWLVRMGHRSDNPIDRMRRPRAVVRHPRPVSNDDMSRLLASVNRFRTRAMVLLAAFQGLRVFEIAKVRGEDFDGGMLTVLGKGNKLARVPLHPVIAQLATQMPTAGYWFRSYANPAQPITSRNVSRVVSEAMERAGVHGTCHQLRHWFGTQALEHSLDLRSVQELMRHESPATTAKYTQVSDERRRATLIGLPFSDDAIEVLSRPRRDRSGQYTAP